MIHGLHCKTNTFPLNCRYCGERIFFFSCDCGSRVLFDVLGDGWPLHDCQTQPAAGGQSGGTPYAGPSSWGATIGINISGGRQGAYDLLPSLRGGRDSIVPAITKRVRESRNLVRETMRIDPLGSSAEEITEVVRERSQPDLARRFNIGRDSMGFEQLTRAIGDADPVQITVHVDELADDESAIDYLSYTFLAPRIRAGQGIVQNAVIYARLVPLESLGLERLWLAKEIELLY